MQWRVLVITDANIGGLGGAEQHLKLVVEGLDKRQFHVDVLQLEATVPYPSGTKWGANLYHLPTGRLASLHGLRRMLQVVWRMRKGQYDCILSLFESADLMSWGLGKLAGIKARISSRRDTGYRHSDRIRRAYRRIDPTFDAIIAPSEAVATALVAGGTPAGKIRLVRNGVDINRFERGNAESVRRELGVVADETLVTIVANLDPVKDHETLFNAIQKLHRTHHQVRLAVVGEGELESELRANAEELGVAERVHFLGRRADIPDILAATDIFVLCSLTEGMSNAILEAMAAGRPVVATAVGGNTELVKHNQNGLLVSARDADGIAAALEELIADPARRATLGCNGRSFVEQGFSLKAMVEQYATLIESAIKSANSGGGFQGRDERPCSSMATMR